MRRSQQATHGVCFFVVENPGPTIAKSISTTASAGEAVVLGKHSQIQLANIAKVPIKKLDISAWGWKRVSHAKSGSPERFRARDVPMNELECDELVVLLPDSADEEETGVSPIHDLGICRRGGTSGQEATRYRHERDGRTFVLEEIAHARSPSQHELRDILYDLGCRTGRGRCIVSTGPCLRRERRRSLRS